MVRALVRAHGKSAGPQSAGSAWAGCEQEAAPGLAFAWRSHGAPLTTYHGALLTTYYLLLTTYYCAPLALRALAQPVAAALARVQTLLVVRLVRPPVIVEELLVAG